MVGEEGPGRRPQALTRPLWPAVHAAVTLLASGDVGRLKACAGCRFLFVDESKNRSRRWCSMEDCGRAEKMRLYVGRRRARSGIAQQRSPSPARSGTSPGRDATPDD